MGCCAGGTVPSNDRRRDAAHPRYRVGEFRALTVVLRERANVRNSGSRAPQLRGCISWFETIGTGFAWPKQTAHGVRAFFGGGSVPEGRQAVLIPLRAASRARTCWSGHFLRVEAPTISSASLSRSHVVLIVYPGQLPAASAKGVALNSVPSWGRPNLTASARPGAEKGSLWMCFRPFLDAWSGRGRAL